MLILLVWRLSIIDKGPELALLLHGVLGGAMHYEERSRDTHWKFWMGCRSSTVLECVVCVHKLYATRIQPHQHQGKRNVPLISLRKQKLECHIPRTTLLDFTLEGSEKEEMRHYVYPNPHSGQYCPRQMYSSG